MKRPMHRLLRVRELVEDLARLAFEGKNAEMRSLATAAERQRRLARSGRADAVQILAGGASTGREGWLMKMADAEISSWKEAKLEALREAAKPAVDQAQGELLARRVERRQVEILHENAARAEEKREVRREQNRTDDWFQSRAAGRTERKG
jgi:Flagellar FliJ protein